MLMAAGLPRALRWLPPVRDLFDRSERDRALVAVEDSLRRVATTVRARSPQARVLFVDYLTLLPPAGTPAPPLADTDVALGRRIADTLERLTGAVAAETGCGWVRAAEASRDHHAWSAQPWTTKPGVPWPRRPAPMHPNADGMRAVADMIVAAQS
jgi:hypothetical protein